MLLRLRYFSSDPILGAFVSWVFHIYVLGTAVDNTPAKQTLATGLALHRVHLAHVASPIKFYVQGCAELLVRSMSIVHLGFGLCGRKEKTKKSEA